jgi:DNA invertase Pin-like site-specific DNA recombinase
MNHSKNPANPQPVNNYRTSAKVRDYPPNAKLTVQQVQEIRMLGFQGVTTAALAERFSMSKTAIKAILSRRTWKDTKDTPQPETPPEITG